MLGIFPVVVSSKVFSITILGQELVPQTVAFVGGNKCVSRSAANHTVMVLKCKCPDPGFVFLELTFNNVEIVSCDEPLLVEFFIARISVLDAILELPNSALSLITNVKLPADAACNFEGKLMLVNFNGTYYKYLCRLTIPFPGRYTVRVTVDKRTISNEEMVNVLPSFTLYKIFPSFVSQSGGYFVTIYGFGFSNVTALSCWFDEVPVPAVVSSPGELFCKTPAWTQPQFVNVSVNGRGSLSFEYLSPLSIQRVYPTVGLVSTAFMVSVQADGLMQTAICKVNDIETDCL